MATKGWSLHAASRRRGAVGRSRLADADVVRAVRTMVRAVHDARRRPCDAGLQQPACTAGTEGRAAEVEDRRLEFDGIIDGSAIATVAARPAPDQHFSCDEASAASSSATPQQLVLCGKCITLLYVAGGLWSVVVIRDGYYPSRRTTASWSWRRSYTTSCSTSSGAHSTPRTVPALPSYSRTCTY